MDDEQTGIWKDTNDGLIMSLWKAYKEQRQLALPVYVGEFRASKRASGLGFIRGRG